MHFRFQILTIIPAVFSLAPLEQPDNSGVYFGPWVDRLHGDSINATNQRLNYKSMSLFQGDVNITATLQSDFVDDIFNQVTGTNSDAIVYLTVYPIEGFAAVSDAAVSQLASKVANLTQSGTRIFVRYASEMNGAWFAYGQQPAAFIASWKRVVGAVRDAVGKNGTGTLAFVWAPNSGLGYPFPSDRYSALPGTAKWDSALDTNKDGKFDISDDPYTPFYPGDEWVDWVGMSTYTYGTKWLPQSGLNPSGWITNDIPQPGKVEDIITGHNGLGTFNFYQMFCGNGQGGRPKSISAGGKPMMITETAATVHLAVLQTNGNWAAVAGSDPQSRVAIKRGWYMQMLNSTFLSTYSKIKGISFFEFIKFEETTWRDFTVFGGDGNLTSPLGNDGAAKDGQVLSTFQNDLANGLSSLIIWANATVRINTVTNTTNATTSTTTTRNGAHPLMQLQPMVIFIVSSLIAVFWI